MSRRARILRIALGFLLAPLTPVLVLLAISLGTGGIVWRESLLLIEIGIPAVYIPAIVLGGPTFAALRWRRWDGLLAYVVAAALIGVIVWLAMGVAVPAKPPRSVGTNLLLQARGLLPLVLACSLAVCSAFWAIVRPDQFDKAETAKPTSQN